MSDDAVYNSRNLRASPYAGKQASWGCQRAWWFIVLARGQIKLVSMGTAWKQNGHGMSQFVNRLPAVLDEMLGKRVAKPRVCFTDKGPGFYVAACGSIVDKYKHALDANGFRAFAGSCAKDFLGGFRRSCLLES